MIYHYVFYGTATIQQKKGQMPVGRERNISKRPTKPPMDSPNLSLLYVSRQLYHETALLRTCSRYSTFISGLLDSAFAGPSRRS
jgi:hypothetical protein